MSNDKVAATFHGGAETCRHEWRLIWQVDGAAKYRCVICGDDEIQRDFS